MLIAKCWVLCPVDFPGVTLVVVEPVGVAVDEVTEFVVVESTEEGVVVVDVGVMIARVVAVVSQSTVVVTVVDYVVQQAVVVVLWLQ